MILALLGCSKEKTYAYDRRRGGRVLPEELYTSQLFKARLAHVKARGLSWAVLSARFGLWEPKGLRDPRDGGENKPYDLTMEDLDPAAKALWHALTAYNIINRYVGAEEDQVAEPRQLSIELHAGHRYIQPLANILKAVGVATCAPVAILGIGEQLAYYKNYKVTHETLSTDAS